VDAAKRNSTNIEENMMSSAILSPAYRTEVDLVAMKARQHGAWSSRANIWRSLSSSADQDLSRPSTRLANCRSSESTSKVGRQNRAAP